MNIIFAGTPDFAVAPLQALIESEHTVVAVYTQPDRPAGRGQKLTPSPVKQCALEHNIPVLQPVTLKDETAQQTLAEHNADLMVVVAYGLILPKAVLDAPRLGCINIHGSILPEWRGAAPIQRSIEAGDVETGVTIMQMDVGLDTGDMLLIEKTPISTEDTAQTIHDRLSTLGAKAMMQVISQLENGTANPIPQEDSRATYAHKMSKAEAEINWTESAQTLSQRIRAFNPWPVCFTQLDGKPLRIWMAHATTENTHAEAGTIVKTDKQGLWVSTGDSLLCVTELQPAGKKRMNAADFANSRPLEGTVLGQ